MKIYLAAPWVRKEEAKGVRKMLRERGHVVTSRWLDFVKSSTDTYHSAVMRREAYNDIDDIKVSDLLFVLNLEKSEGKATEQGIALMLGIPIIAVGPWEVCKNVFQYHDNVTRFDHLDEAIEHLDLLTAPLHNA